MPNYTDVSQITNNTNQVYYENGRKNLGSSRITREGFIQLMLAQLQNQDPTEPQDNSQMLQQQLQLEQADQMSAMTNAIQFSQASSMIGKGAVLVDASWNFDTNSSNTPEYDTTTNSPKVVSGLIESIQFDQQNGVALALINGKYYDTKNIKNLFTPAETPNIGDISNAAALIGKTVKVVDAEWNPATKTFKSPTLDSAGLPQLITGTIENIQFDSSTRKTLIQIGGKYYDLEGIQQTLTSSAN